MKSNNKILLFFAVLFLILLNNIDALACSCGAKPSVLEEYESSDLVVITKVISVELEKKAKRIDFEAERKRTGFDNSDEYVKSTKVVVEKVYKGNVKVGDELIFGQGGGADCISTFRVTSVGRRYLFYLGQPTKNHPYFDDKKMSKFPRYYAGTCGRDQGVGNYESDDLKFLNRIDQVKGKTRISGEFNCWWTGCPDSFANLKVKIIGENKTYETKTDENGVYEIYDLPANKYLINPEKPKGWKIDNFMLRYSPASQNGEYWFTERNQDFSEGVPVKLEEKKHTGIDFYFVVDTAIRGKVLSPDGKPMKGVCVNAVSTKLKEGDYRGPSNCTNEDGIFIIDELPANKYILVVNNDGKISAKEPFGTLFYPNTTKYSEAKSFELKLGDYLDGFTIQIPKNEETVTISGKLLYSNDIPVADETIKFDINKKEKNIDGEQSYIRTDKQGNFSFKVLKGFAGTMFGEMYVYESKFKDCHQLFKDVKKKLKRKDSGNLTTEKIVIDATKDVSNLVVKFDFQGCKKAKE